MIWEVVFLLVLLKIPLVYLCIVVWWAIRAVPRDEHPVLAAPVPDTPTPPSAWGRPVRRPRPPEGRRGRRERAPARSASRTLARR